MKKNRNLISAIALSLGFIGAVATSANAFAFTEKISNAKAHISVYDNSKYYKANIDCNKTFSNLNIEMKEKVAGNTSVVASDSVKNASELTIYAKKSKLSSKSPRLITDFSGEYVRNGRTYYLTCGTDYSKGSYERAY